MGKLGLIERKPLFKAILEKEEEARKIYVDLQIRKGDDAIETIVAHTRLVERVHFRRMVQNAERIWDR